MSRACGTELRSSTARAPSSVRLAALVVPLCAGALAGPAAASPKPPLRHQPTELWQSYPLEQKPARVSQRPIRADSTRTTAFDRAADSGPSTAAWVAGGFGLLGAFVALGAASRHLTARVAAARAVRPARPETLRRVDSELATALFGAAQRSAPAASTRKEAPAEHAAALKLKKKEKTRVGVAPGGGEPRDQRVLKAKLAASPKRAPQAARSTARSASCRIDWWRGYVKSQFYARLLTSEGGGSVVRSSASFRWSKPTPPPKDLPHIADAHARLVSQLEADGWVKTGRGKDWYALELKRRPPHSPQPAQEGDR